MAIEQFPMFKLATLIARQFTAPVAQRIKVYARRHPVFSRAVCMRVARLFRGAELRFKMWSVRASLGSVHSLHSPHITDKDALEAGADILGEAIVFIIGAAIMIFEINRQALKTEAKAADEMSKWVAVVIALEELQKELSLQQKEIDSLWRELAELVDTSQHPEIMKHLDEKVSSITEHVAPTSKSC